MKINNISSYEVIEMLWKKLPDNGLGGSKIFAVVDIEDGEVFYIYEPQGIIIPKEENEEVIFVLEAASKSQIISDWVLDEHIIDWDEIQRGKTRYDLHEDDLYSCTVDVLHEWNEKEINKRIEEILQKIPTSCLMRVVGRKEGKMNFDIRANVYNMQIYEPSEYLQEVDNFVYLLHFNCTNCFTKNILMFNKHVIDNELEDKQTYIREETCTACRKKIMIEFRKKIEVKVKE